MDQALGEVVWAAVVALRIALLELVSVLLALLDLLRLLVPLANLLDHRLLEELVLADFLGVDSAITDLLLQRGQRPSSELLVDRLVHANVHQLVRISPAARAHTAKGLFGRRVAALSALHQLVLHRSILVDGVGVAVDGALVIQSDRKSVVLGRSVVVRVIYGWPSV